MPIFKLDSHAESSTNQSTVESGNTQHRSNTKKKSSTKHTLAVVALAMLMNSKSFIKTTLKSTYVPWKPLKNDSRHIRFFGAEFICLKFGNLHGTLCFHQPFFFLSWRWCRVTATTSIYIKNWFSYDRIAAGLSNDSLNHSIKLFKYLAKSSHSEFWLYDRKSK